MRFSSMTQQKTHYDFTPKGKFKGILMFGPPGSGKGTQSAVLGSRPDFVHVASGDIFRGLDPKSPAGQLFADFANKGLLVPDEATMQIWLNYVRGLVACNQYVPAKETLLIDGLPRTVQQVSMVAEYVEIQRVIVLEVPHVDILLKRLQRRASEGRIDDSKAEVLKKRFEVYEAQTLPVLEHYPESLIRRINADQPPLMVLADVIRGIYH